MEKKNLHVFILLLILLAILAIAVYSIPFFSEMQKIRQVLENTGHFAPIIFMCLQVLQVIVAPIPGQLTGFLGGYFFGVWLGTLYSTIGTVAGTIIVAALARKFGRPFVVRLAGKKNYRKFNRFFKKRGEIFLFLIYLLPFFPDDAISAIAGLSKIKIRTIAVLAAVGGLPGRFWLSLLGAGVAQANASCAIIILGILIALSFIIYLKRGFLEKLLYKNIQKNKNNNLKNKNTKISLALVSSVSEISSRPFFHWLGF